MKTILITGAGGYIGSILVHKSLIAGYKVVALDRFFFGIERLEEHTDNPYFTLIKKDIRDVEPKDFENIDAVFDLAALSNDPSGDLDPDLTKSINYQGRAHLAQCAKEAGVSRYILASSCSVYGNSGDQPVEETASAHPLTHYAKSNLSAENAVLALCDKSFCVSVLRQGTVFGLSPRMRFDLVVNLMTLHAMQKGKIFVTGGGHQFRPLIHVTDAARAFLQIFETKPEHISGQIFNIGHKNLKIINIAYSVREILPFPIEIEIISDDPDKRHYCASFKKISQKIGFQTKTSIEQGIEEIYNALKTGTLSVEPWHYTVAWYKNILESKKLIEKIELQGRLL